MVAIRPKLVWRLLIPGLAAAFGALALIDGGAVAWFIAVASAVGALAAWREYARIDGGVLYERGPLRWHDPVVLSDVTSISLHYDIWSRDLPHRVLLLWSEDGHRVTMVSLRWWASWRPFVAAIVDAVSEPGPDGRAWKVKIDGKSAERLTEIANLVPSP